MNRTVPQLSLLLRRHKLGLIYTVGRLTASLSEDVTGRLLCRKEQHQFLSLRQRLMNENVVGVSLRRPLPSFTLPSCKHILPDMLDFLRNPPTT